MVGSPYCFHRRRQRFGHAGIFAVAFYASNDEFMAANWQGIAFVDYLFKLAICTLFFLPAYGIVLSILTKKLTSLNVRQEMPESVLAE